MQISSLIDFVLHRYDRLIYPKTKISKLTYTAKLTTPKTSASYTQKIPFHVWQTWKTIHLPPRLFRVLQRFRRNNPEYYHHLFNDQDCDNFMREFYRGTDVETAYFRINPNFGAARADLWRYCVLYKFGGVYIDIDSTCTVPLRAIIQDNDEAILSHENNTIEAWKHSLSELGFANLLNSPPEHRLQHHNKVLLQWLLIYTPQHPFLKQVIEDTTHTILSRRSFSNQSKLNSHLQTLVFTGPLRYTSSIWKVLDMRADRDIQYRVDGIDFSGKALFQYFGQSDKDTQSKHYTSLSESLIVGDK